MYITTKSGQRHTQKHLVWKLLVQWKNRTGQWIPLKDLNMSNPAEVAYFESARGI